MMGIKVYQEKMFYNFSLDKRVPEEHFLRKVDKIIDLRFVRELVAPYYSYTGQPSIDPEVLFKMMLIGYFYNITSERRLAEEISLNLAYMWYLGYDLDEETPNHSVISKARARYGKEVFEKFFNRILSLCIKSGLVKCDKIYIDSTLIEANASIKSVIPKSDALELKLTPKEFMDCVFKENPVEDKAGYGETTQSTDKYSPGGNGIKNEKRTSFYRETHISNDDYISKTDPDASIIGRPGKGLHLMYKEHFTIDSYGRVITGVSVTGGTVEDSEKLEELITKQPIKPKEVGADSKYGTADIYKYLSDEEILPSIPRWHKPNPRAQNRVWQQDKFRYDREKDVYVCPAGKQLKKSSFFRDNKQWAYRSKVGDCRECRFSDKCLGKKTKCRSVCRHIYQDEIDKALEYLNTSQAKQTIKDRKIYAEWVSAESKTLHGLRRTRYRGLWKVAIQALLTASVQSIKRLVKHWESEIQGRTMDVDNLIQVGQKFCYKIKNILKTFMGFIMNRCSATASLLTLPTKSKI